MRTYIVDLTNHLISKNRYVPLFETLDGKKFIESIKNDLFFGDVWKMNPSTLGKIMCSFEIGDVMTRHPGKEVAFGGNCESMLREMVALCLAYVIRDRLDPQVQEYSENTPPYLGSKKKNNME